jgi:tripartite-type tricarboxylate transporter receptor subunit TctC
MTGGQRISRAFMVRALTLTALFTLLLAATPGWAQTWPTRPVKFILTLGPGSGADIGARLLADRLSKKWDQPIVIENRPGGDGIVAITAFLSAHDDHVLLFTPSSSFLGHPYQLDNPPYKQSDLAPIARVSNTVVAISVPADLPVKSFKELVELVRSKPGQLNWAGLTGALDMILEGWFKNVGLDIKKIPYRNPVEAVNDLAAGRVQVYEGAYAIVRPQIQAGKIKTLAITNTERAAAIPDIPTVAQAGFPALTIDGLVGLFGPTSMPMALRERIAADIKSVMESDPTIKERLIQTAQVPNPGGPAEFAASIAEQSAVVAKAAKELGITGK